jgi:hypothetical protein
MKIKENDTLYCIKSFKNVNAGDLVTVASVTKDGLFLVEENEFFYPENLFVPSIIEDSTTLSDLT